MTITLGYVSAYPTAI